VHVNYSIWWWVGASNNDPTQRLHALSSAISRFLLHLFAKRRRWTCQKYSDAHVKIASRLSGAATALHGRKLGKMWEGPSHSIWGTTPRTSAKGRVGVSMERQCIGLGVILCLDSLDWRMKIVGHEKFVSANFCCLYFTTVRLESPRLMWPRYSSEFMSTFWPWLKKDFFNSNRKLWPMILILS